LFVNRAVVVLQLAFVPPLAGEGPLPRHEHEHEEAASDRLRDLLSRVVTCEDASEVRTVIDLLKQMDGVPAGLHRDVLGILHSFHELPPSAQERLLPALIEALEPSPDDHD
jgi:hypothetical protein